MSLADKLAAKVTSSTEYAFSPDVRIYVTPATNKATGKPNKTAGNRTLIVGDYRNNISVKLTEGRDPTEAEYHAGLLALGAMLDAMLDVVAAELPAQAAQAPTPAVIVTPPPARPAGNARNRLAASIAAGK